ncbi:MAG: hypothetical protein LBC12_04535 [Nitrososphaerota archaeon]|nr:hypothetical protein [Nitrososphaerota archaeon]
MTRPKDTNTLQCQNFRCKYCQKETNKNTIKHGKTAQNTKSTNASTVTNTSHKPKTQPYTKKHLTEQQIANICKHLVEKNGIRSIERLTGHHQDTIGTVL